jgi:NADH-quinone oxidoreductase subunit J
MVLAVLALAGLIAAVFAALMVFQRSLYASAICLLVVLTQVSVFFFLAGAALLAFLQLMIYAGAVMVLIVIAISAAPSTPSSPWSALAVPRFAAAAVVILPLAEIFLATRGLGGASAAGLSLQPTLASVLFGPYAVATEAVTFLMFLAGLAMTGGDGSTPKDTGREP